MKINVICVGKLKENYLRKAEQEYLKRLSGYARVNVTELKDESQGGSLSDDEVRKREGERILNRIDPASFKIAMDIDGKMMSSTDLASFVEEKCVRGTSSFTFIIGGSVGLDESVRKTADMRLSFSPLTFPHQLFRIMLLEQIYRVMKINSNETYHK